jgi:hypothetical protein
MGTSGIVKDNGDGGLERTAIPVQDFITGSVRRPLLILFGAAGVVLLIACANVINLLLAKADVRRKEVAIVRLRPTKIPTATFSG